MRIFILILIAGCAITPSDSALSTKVVEYIRGLIGSFKGCNGQLFYAVIDPPTPNICTIQLQGDDFLFPSVLLWNPWITHPMLVNAKVLYCPNCGGELQEGNWNDGSSQSNQPRTIHGLSNIVLLVSASYTCTNGHKLLAHDEKVLQCFPVRSVVPFILLHKTGFTRDFVDTCITMCQRGMNFYTIESLVIERRWESFARKQQMFEYYQTLTQLVVNSFPNFKDTQSFKTPSNNGLTKCFIAAFFESEKKYLQHIHSVNVTESISFDHTFKSAANIGYLREDGVWVPQYDSLFLVLGANGQILTWQLTNGTSFAKVEPLLKDLCNRANGQQNQVRTVFVDDCCKLRAKIQSIFGRNVSVKLDLFHAIQRITRTVPKRHPLSKACMHHLRLVFRADGDTGEKRLSATPVPHVIIKKLQNFIDTWINETDGYGKNVITESTMQAIANLKHHITHGCLSDIPPGGGTNRNERFHSHLNAFIHRSRIGILLAYALMSVLIHAHNNSYISAGKLVVAPISALLPTEPSTMPNPIGIIPKCRSEDTHFEGEDHWELDQSPLSSDMSEVVSVYRKCLSKLWIYRILAQMNLSELLKDIHSFQECDILPCPRSGVDISASAIQSHLSERGLILTPVQPDGNCFFTAIAMTITSNSTTWNDCLRRIGMTTPFTEVTSLASRLRQLFVEELLGENRCRYEAFLDIEGQTQYDKEAQALLQDGNFSSDMGDLMPTAMCNVLRTTLVVFITTNLGHPQYFSPYCTTNSTHPSVFLVYNPSGPSHYDAALPHGFLKSKKNKTACTTQTSCSCGVNKDNLLNTSCNPSTLYRSRCKCFNTSQPCTTLCRCKNCVNPFGPAPSRGSRKRRTHAWQTEVPTAKKFAQDRGESLSQAIWSDFETIVLKELITMHHDTTDILKVYNDIVNYACSVICTCPLTTNVVFRNKSFHQIQSKISHLHGN